MTTRITDLDHAGYERVVRVENEAADMYGYIAVHNTNLGPGLGGVRCNRYATGDEALADVLELSKAMTLKSSLAGINYGGGKAVLHYLEGMNRTSVYSAFGEAVEILGGTYLAVGDVGTSTDDLKVLKTQTQHCYGTDLDSGIPTAQGLMFAFDEYCTFNDIDFKDLSVSISGLGKVGGHLAYLLGLNDCTLYVSDMQNAPFAKLYDLMIEAGCGKLPMRVGTQDSHRYGCEIFSPCALGHALNRCTRIELNCNAVIGSANNQLEDMETARFLHNRGILYLPDFLVNAGGVIALACEIENRMEDLESMLATIGHRVEDLLHEEGSASPLVVATEMAWERIDNGD